VTAGPDRLIVRKVVTGEDSGEVARLRWRWRAAEAGEIPEESLGTEASFAAALSGWTEEHAGTHTAWLAEVDDVPVGTVWLCVVDRIPGPGRWQRRAGVLQSLYVMPEHRGEGIGARLIEAVLVEARRRGLDYVSVHPTERSFPLYRRAGFRENDRTLEVDLRPQPR
jgi:GNAT superfamily N-acetyltransferase